MIQQIENSLNINLPMFYKNTLLDYPFTVDSFAYEFMLVNHAEMILSYNQLDFLNIINKANCFVIGSDGGEEYYYILLNDNDTVYTYSLETKKSEIYSNNWTDYIDKLHSIELEIIQDEADMLANELKPKWWQWWIN